MIIKLQPDQIVLFWDLIRKSMIESNKVPIEFQQDYAISMLTKFLSGKTQAWLMYKINESGNKEIIAITATSIIDEKFYGIRVLNSEALYGFRLVTEDVLNEMIMSLTEFAKANKCKMLSADYSINRVKEILHNLGFEEHRTVCRKFIS